MARMSGKTVVTKARRIALRPATCAVAATALACVCALVFRTALQSRYWAWRIEHTTDLEQQNLYVGALCSAGDAARWGIAALLASDDVEVRQYGVLVLHHVRTSWACQRLVEALKDSDTDIKRLAAVGLGIHADDTVVPALAALYRGGDDATAEAACIALEHLGTQRAVAAAQELASEPGSPARRAALIDTLAGIDAPECIPALLILLSDQRPCSRPARADEAARRVLGGLLAQGEVLPVSLTPATQPAATTLAERAAAALAQITGLRPPFSSDAPTAEQHGARQAWEDWWRRHESGQ